MQGSRRRWLGTCVLAASALVEVAHASQIRIDRVAATSQGFLYVEFELEAPFEGVYQEALRSGLPTTLNYTIQVWRQRSGWWDRLEGTYERPFRIFRDLLNEIYYAVTPEATFRFTHPDSLAAAVSRFARDAPQGPQYFAKQLFQPDQQFYVVITATLAPLTVDDLNELDTWLRGTLAGRGDDAGGISGITSTIGGMLMSMTGFGDKQYKARTPRFTPAEILRAPLQPREVAPERRLTAPEGRAP